ncbi:MAG: 2-amino-4-hydroxy-6-hydroxymethyldihydropteridine diphosphokinase [Ignavibacteriaceae bacterium]|nr:2-amino-4-hydroxy-6-hydroxymethyldihydropteridine diphosphokinase [Ignavibacteriaceae bacterium]
MEVTVFLGIGSNIEPRNGYIMKALRLLTADEHITFRQLSSKYRTRPFGITDQGEFLNIVAEIGTDYSPVELFRVVKQTEELTGRVKREKWGAREIDIDILLYGDSVYQSDQLDIPHKGLMSRDFFVIPLLEIYPDAVNPGTGEKLSTILFDAENSFIAGKYEPEEESIR